VANTRATGSLPKGESVGTLFRNQFGRDLKKALGRTHDAIFSEVLDTVKRGRA
jgi:hypothetical protein